eukprot:Nitzschia sp. Nitz4//scaffold71_size96697//41966//44816//NITZ4_004693-RA/size96697-augustus-gene-0.144-mRNA-1//1//CDS//3329557241//2718//frame0
MNTERMENQNGEEQATEASGCPGAWSRFIKQFHTPIVKSLTAMARQSALNPKITILMVIVISLATMAVGLFTNFNVDVNEDTLWSPRGCKPVSHFEWIENESGFPLATRDFVLTIHADGDDVLGKDGVERVFVALDTIRETQGYNDICQVETGEGEDEEPPCHISGVTALWGDSYDDFQATVTNDDEAIEVLSSLTYPDDSPVDHSAIMGKPAFDSSGMISAASLYLLVVQLPNSPVDDEDGPVETFEEKALENIEALQQKWLTEQGNKFRIEYMAERSFSDEFERAILKDIPLVPGVFVMMSIFTALVFFKCDKVQSRATMGFGAVCCVFLAIATGYGLLFIIGTPFTSMTQILPFIMFGIGLDGAFILSGSFLRTSPSDPIVHRIEQTVEDIGMSITLTTLTSTTAFALGCLSTIPAVIWLCLYAFPTILISFLYQFTFFIAIMVIDERRVLDNRRDCLCCVTVSSAEDEEEAMPATTKAAEPQESRIDKFMGCYADHILLNNWAKAMVIVAFAGLLGGCAYSASKLKQSFDFSEVLPDDSYIVPFVESLDDYSSRGGATVDVYFRNQDQSSPDVQAQMESYIDALTAMDQIENPPSFFWLRDFHSYVETNDITELSFEDQFAQFFQDPVYNEIYGEDIVLAENGTIIASRTTMYMNNVPQDSAVTELIRALEDQRDVTSKQDINKGLESWSFFTYTEDYLIWEFYSVAVEELILSTVLGVVSVTILSTLMMPHWSAFFFVGPLICVLYVDLLGVLQWAGIAVNPVSYISMVMSIGLLVDFIVHVLLRYYEETGTRYERTKSMLKTMGSSVLLGGISTFLGVLPLAFSTSNIFFTVFVTFLGLVLLGMAHGLLLLPVLLSIFGPETAKK